MAKMTIQGLDEYAVQLSRLGSESIEICKKAVFAGAQPVADEMRKNLEEDLSGSDLSKGALLDSMGIAPAAVDHYGNVDTKVGFHGYDPNSKPSKKYPQGTPNALKARAKESGTSVQRKKPFIRPAIRATKDEAVKIIGEVVDQEMKKLMK